MSVFIELIDRRLPMTTLSLNLPSWSLEPTPRAKETNIRVLQEVGQPLCLNK